MTEQTISKNAAIEVIQVTNGYFVRLPYVMTRGDFQPIENSMVFNSFVALSVWLSQHFTHRDVGRDAGVDVGVDK